MSELACNLRSVWETLVAAAFTVGFFMAANWGHGLLMGDYFRSAFYPILMPYIAFFESLRNASRVRGVKTSLVYEEYLRGRTDETEKKMRESLMDLYGFAALMKDIMDRHGTIAIITLIPMYIQFPASALTSDELHNLTESRGYQRITYKNELRDMCPLKGHPAANRAIVTDADEQVLWLPADNVKEKDVLLRLGLAPTYKELSFLRSRNKFKTVLTGLQAGGYMLTVLQRAAQILGISPVEAFVTFLCITLCIQLLMEFYACGHFQRPLLLRLNAPQLRSLYVAKPRPSDLYEGYSIAYLLFMLLILGLAMYYFVHYLHIHLICSLSALLFFLATLAHYLSNVFLRWRNFLDALYFLLYVVSLIFAVVSTIVDWKAFQETNQKAWYAWILPHVSS